MFETIARHVPIKKTELLSSLPNQLTHLGSLMLLGTTAGLLMLSASRPAYAFNLYNGTYAGQDLEISLTTTLEYSVTQRVNDPSAVLLNNVNGNEGDDNFRHGIVDNTFDALPVFDLKYGSFGAHVSGELYLDTPYLSPNQGNNPAAFNPYTTSYNKFTSATRNVNGENAILLDAFVYDGINFGKDDQQTATLKVGRQTLFWGQSLLFASNGISAGQAPIDIIKAQSLPNAENQQIFLPVGQIVATYQPNQTYTIQGYYQFEWQHDFFQGVGAYFNSSDILDKGGQRLLVGPASDPQAAALYRVKSLTPPIENGQFGLSLQATYGVWDLGIYGLRYDSKSPEIYDGAPQPGTTPAGAAGSYWTVYPRDIQIYGASFSTDVRSANVAGEISTRRNMNLVAGGLGAPPSYPGSANAGALYPVGNTLASQISAIYVSDGVPLVPGGISYTGEVAANHLLSVTGDRAGLAVGRQATAAAFHIIMTPNYYGVLPKLDISFPIGIAYNFLGRSEIDGTMNHGTGVFNIGIQATYRTTWIAAITYQDYLGKADPTLNGDADRGYINLNIQHSF